VQYSYILRLTPQFSTKLLTGIQSAGGVTTIEEAARALSASEVYVSIMAQDLRELGVLSELSSDLRFTEDVAASPDLDQAVRQRARMVLRGHRVLLRLSTLASKSGKVSLGAFTEALARIFPDADATRQTWPLYARAFAKWLEYAGLATLERDQIILPQPAPVPMAAAPARKKARVKPLRRRRGGARGIRVFPRTTFEFVLRLLQGLSDDLRMVKPTTKPLDRVAKGRAILDAKALGWLTLDEQDRPSVTLEGESIVTASPAQRSEAVRSALEAQSFFPTALESLEHNPGYSAVRLGQALAESADRDWSELTARDMGRNIRNWARAAGVTTIERDRPLTSPPRKSSLRSPNNG